MKLMDWIGRGPARIGFDHRGPGLPALNIQADSTGVSLANNHSLPLVTGATAGLLGPTDKTKLDGLQNTLVSTDALSFQTRSQVAATVITDSQAMHVRTAGHDTAGDGGDALYMRVASEPAHQGKIQSADGAWWEAVFTGPVNVMAFPGNGIGAKVNAALEFAREGHLAAAWTSSIKELYIPSGIYAFDETIVAHDIRNLRILAHGVTIQNFGSSDTVLSLITCSNVIVEGLFVDVRNNHSIDQAVLIGGQCSWCKLDSVKIQAASSNTNFAAFRCLQGDINGPDDDERNKGNFWITLERCWIRKLTGGDVSIPIGMDIQGANNSLRIINCSLNNTDTGILIQNQNGSTLSNVSNDVQIVLSAFESVGISVKCTTTNSSDSVPSVKLTNNRFEVADAVLELDGFGSSPDPIFLAANTIISSVVAYVISPHETWWNSFDTGVTPSIKQPRLYGSQGLVLGTTGGSGSPPLQVVPKQVGDGGTIVLRRLNHGARDGMIAQRPGGGMDIYSPDLAAIRLASVRAISGSQTFGSNFRGVVNPSSGTSIDVTFTLAEPNTAYYAFLTGTQDRKYWYTNKTVNGFTINTDTAWTAADEVAWMIIR